MNKQQESGMVTLLFTSFLLVALLILTLTSYKPLLLHIRMSNNQVEKVHSRWVAEGGLHCIYSQINNQSVVDSSIGRCGLPEELELQVTKLNTENYLAQSRYRYAMVSGVITVIDGEYQWQEGSWCDF